MPRIIATTITTYSQPRDDKKVKDERWHLSDGRQVKIETYRDGGTRTLAYLKHEVDTWHATTVAVARRIIKLAKDLPDLP